MDIRRFLPDCVLVIFLVFVHFGISLGIEDDYDDGPATFNRCPWIRNKLKNGRVKYRYRGRVAKFVCDSGYELAGKRSSTCVAGQWSNPLPVCVARGCRGSTMIANGRVTEMLRGALLAYECNPGYALEGASSIHCDGRRWNTAPPLCSVATETPEMFCDFENPDLCGWTHDPNHDFDWKRNQFATPSGYVGTGPSFDHTFGENKGGYYLYIEASTPRKLNDTARIFSPVYFPNQSGGCFLFWYHMYGATTGGLRVYLKPESHVLDELSPNWEKFGDQGNQWFRGNIDLPVLNENFQIVIEGIRGESYVGDSAIDDVSLTPNNCLTMENETETTEKTIADSCRGRCRESESVSSCGCNDNCNAAQNCCRDYLTLCYEVPGNDTTGPNGDEPGDFYGRTTVPSTVTTYFTTVKLPSTSSESTSMSSTGFPVSTLSTSSTTTSTTVPSVNPLTVSTISPITSTLPTAPSTTVPTSTSSQSSTYITTSSSTSVITGKGTTRAPIPISTSTTSSTEKTKETTTKLTTRPTTSTSTTPMPTTISSTTAMKSTTTLTSTSSTTQTTPIVYIPEKSSSTTRITSQVFTTASSEIDKTSTTTSTIIPSRFTESSQSSSSSDITTFLSTRKTYNLRPRSTTPSSVSTKNSVTESSTARNVTSGTAQVERVTIAISSSTQSSTIWYNIPATKPSTVIQSSSIVAPSTIISSTKTTSSSTKKPTTISTQTSKRNPTKKFSFLTSTSFPLHDRINQQDSSKSQTSPNNSSVPIVVSVIAIVLITMAGGVVYYMRKHRNKRQSKLSDDSEMRYLEENDYMDYSDASALDKILTK